MVKGHITYNGREIEEVRCKLCQTPIRGLVVDDTRTEKIKTGSTNTILQRLKLVSFANYTELQFEVQFSDGKLGTHVTSICKECSESVDNEIAEKLMRADLENLLARGAKFSFGLQDFKILRRL